MIHKIKNMSLKAKIISGGVLIALVSFYAGTFVHSSSKAPTNQRGVGLNNASGFSRTIQRNNPTSMMGNTISGSVVSKTDTNIVIKTKDGSSKTVFFSPSTKVEKQTSSTISDVSTNSEISVIGQANPDGSIVAQTIQVR